MYSLVWSFEATIVTIESFIMQYLDFFKTSSEANWHDEQIHNTAENEKEKRR